MAAFDERRDQVNENITLTQKTDGLTFGTDALLLAGYINGKYKRGCEIGSGSGIISMLLLSRGKLDRTVAVEVQDEYARLSAKNAELNGLGERLGVVTADVREYNPGAEFDLIYTNPPYMKSTSGKQCEAEKKNIARHEICGDIFDFLQATKRLLKFGGTFAVVYRPDRMCDLIDAMRENGIEPKRMTFVHADTESEPSMVLTLGRAGGKCGLIVTQPLIIYKDLIHTEYSDDMKYIMENGSFPRGYTR